MASINEHKNASVHGNFCPRRLSWKAPCTCNAEHVQGCKAVSVDFNDLGACDCGVDAPRDVNKYGVSQPLGVVSGNSTSANIRKAQEAVDKINSSEPAPIEFYDGEITSEDQTSFADQQGLPMTAGIIRAGINKTWIFDYFDKVTSDRKRGRITGSNERDAQQRIAAVYGDVMDWEVGIQDFRLAHPVGGSRKVAGTLMNLVSEAWLDHIDAQMCYGATLPILCGSWLPAVEPAIERLKRESEARQRQHEDEILYGNPEAAEPQGVIYARSAATDRESDCVDDQLREDGFYWVLPHQAEEWEPASWGDEGWMLLGMDSASDIPAIVEVGERIIAPVRGNHA